MRPERAFDFRCRNGREVYLRLRGYVMVRRLRAWKILGVRALRAFWRFAFIDNETYKVFVLLLVLIYWMPWRPAGATVLTWVNSSTAFSRALRRLEIFSIASSFLKHGSCITDGSMHSINLKSKTFVMSCKMNQQEQ
jgi:hypothetical protein